MNEIEKKARNEVKKYLERQGKGVIERKDTGDLEYDGIHIEVKGDSSDWTCEQDEIIRDWFVLGSKRETEYFKKYPDKFELWCVGCLKKNKKNYPMVQIKGSELKEFIDKNPDKKQFLLKIKMGKEFWRNRKTKFIWNDNE